MELNPRKILCIILFLYLILVFTYPFIRDEAIYAVIGKNLGNFELYNALYEHKPPGMFFTMFLASKIPFSTFFVNRLLVFLSITATGFLLMKISEELFKEKSELLLYIPVFYILLSIFYLGGLVPLVETFEMFFAVLSLYLFFQSKKTDYKKIHLLILSSIFLFFAFQYKQTALAFIVVPLIFLFNERKIKEILIFLAVFALSSSLLILLMQNLGIFDSYLDLVWFYAVNRGASLSSELLRNLSFAVIFAVPVLALSLPGAFSEFKNKKIPILSFLLASLIVFAGAVLLFRAFSMRFYLLEFAPLLIIFLPLTLRNFKNKNIIVKLAVILSVAVLLLLFSFILLKVMGFFGGYNSNSNFSDIAHLDSIMKFLSCGEILGPVDYWYLSSIPLSEVKYTLGSWNINYISTIEDVEEYTNSFSKYLGEGKKCYVNYIPKPFYSIPGIYEPPFIENPMFDIAEETCSCNHLDQKSSYSSVCCNCKKN